MINKQKIICLILLICFLSLHVKAQQIKEYFIECKQEDFQYIYSNYKKDIYIPITLTFENKTYENVKMRIRGVGSRSLPKKSLKVKIDNDDINGIKVFNFNADYEDKSYIQAYITSKLMRESGTNCFKTEHVRLYLNKKYLGLYVYVENIDSDFLENNGFMPNGNLYKASIDGASLSRFDNVFYHWEQKTGSGNKEDLQELIFQLDTISIENYKTFLQEKFDYSALINILSLNLLTSNHSTYYHNYYLFHDTGGSGKWYMFPWDLDKTFLYYEATFDYYHTSKFWAPDNPLMELACLSPEVLSDIIERVDSLHHNFVNNNNISPCIDSLTNLLYYSVFEDSTDNIFDMSEWINLMNKSKNKLNIRYNELKKQFAENLKPFRLQRTKNVYKTKEQIDFKWTKCENPKGDQVKYRLYIGLNNDLENSNSTIIINDIIDTVYSFTANLSPGKYYYKLVAYSSNKSAEAFDNYNIFFVDDTDPKIVINEINYNSHPSYDSGQWIELFNYSEDSIDISNWCFSGDNDMQKYKFSKGTIIPANSFIILSNDIEKFTMFFPNLNCELHNFNFKINRSGELLRLYNNLGRLIDSLHYSPYSPWPSQANKMGSSLELINPELDNSIAHNWTSSIRYGSPCNESQTIDTLIENKRDSLLIAYPNPFSESCHISYFAKHAMNILINIYDISGKIVFTKQHFPLLSGFYTFTWDASNFNKGVYFISLIENKIMLKTIRVVLIK